MQKSKEEVSDSLKAPGGGHTPESDMTKAVETIAELGELGVQVFDNKDK